MVVDYLAALGTYWDERPLRDFLSALEIPDVPKLDEDEYSGFLNNHQLGIELTFYPESALKVQLREYPKGAVVLYNIRFYGTKTKLFQPFSGELPLRLQFGASKASLIRDCGPPDFEVPDLGSMRWDRERYCLFAMLSDEGVLRALSLQLPVKGPNR
jgi:hypothetical protein